jgi:peptidoglycan/LPS O-acetylase OafA/YrhL
MGLPYNPALDGLRAVAVLLVLEYHADWHVGGLRGYVGVDIFFVLSGFLITTLLLNQIDDGGIRLWDFYVRRARRLYPALLVLVGACMLAGWVHWIGALQTLLYLADYTGTAGTLAHTWSLAVEEHYYMIWPLVLPSIARMGRKRAAWLLFGCYVAASLWAELRLIEWRENYRFDTRMSGLILGSMVAFLPRDSKVPFALLMAASALLMLGHPGFRQFAEAATACVILLSYQTVIPFLTRAPFVYIGKISYGVYLYHWPVQGIALRYVDGFTQFVLSTLATIAIAAISYHTVEAYFRTSRDSRSAALAPPATSRTG